MLVKKLKCVGLLFLLIGLAISCNDNKLQSAVDDANKSCPSEVPGLGVVKSFTIEDSCVAVTYVVNEKVLTKSDAEIWKELLKENFKTMLHTKAINNLMPVLQEANYGMKIKICWKNTPGELSFAYTPKEIKGWSSYGYKVNSIESLNAQLRAQVIAANRLTPTKLGNGIVLEKIALNDGKWIYYDNITTTGANMENVRKHNKEGKKAMLDSWASSEERGQKEFFNLCIKTNTEIVYRYYAGDTTDVADIVITLSDMKSLLKNNQTSARKL